MAKKKPKRKPQEDVVLQDGKQEVLEEPITEAQAEPDDPHLEQWPETEPEEEGLLADPPLKPIAEPGAEQPTGLPWEEAWDQAVHNVILAAKKFNHFTNSRRFKNTNVHEKAAKELGLAVDALEALESQE